jgi:hypothetical protein
MVWSSKSPSSVSPSIPCTGSPFPPRGPAGRFPRFIGYYWLLGLPVVHRVCLGSTAPVPRFVSFARRYRPSGGDDGISQVPGEPSRACRLLRPRQVREPGLRAMPDFSTHGCCLSLVDGLGSRIYHFRGSITRPSRSLSTLRSQGCPLSPRKTRFRLVALLRRSGFEPAGFLREVSVMSSSTCHPPHPSFAWRTHDLS